jgi:cytochrome bd ubiquinol oxidase subunit II
VQSDRSDTGLGHCALPLLLASAVAGLAALTLLYRRQFGLARVAAAAAVTAVIWGWAVAQYPYLLQRQLTITAGAATRSVLLATLIALGAGALVLIPSLGWLYATFQRGSESGN